MERLHKITWSFFIGLLLILLISCDSWQEVCTSEFRIIGVKVLSSEKEPISLAQITIQNLETDRIIEMCDGALGNCEKGVLTGYPEEGFYFVFHDGVRDEIVGEESKILMKGSNEKISFSEEFQIGDNGCHVFKASGPDTIFVEVN